MNDETLTTSERFESASCYAEDKAFIRHLEAEIAIIQRED